MNTTTATTKTIDSHGGIRVHCQHGTTVCTTKSGINAKAACAKQAEQMATEIYGPTAKVSWSREDVIAYPSARAAYDGQNERYARASNPYLDRLRAAKGQAI